MNIPNTLSKSSQLTIHITEIRASLEHIHIDTRIHCQHIRQGAHYGVRVAVRMRRAPVIQPARVVFRVDERALGVPLAHGGETVRRVAFAGIKYKNDYIK